jgi:hypothetical protein
MVLLMFRSQKAVVYLGATDNLLGPLSTGRNGRNQSVNRTQTVSSTLSLAPDCYNESTWDRTSRFISRSSPDCTLADHTASWLTGLHVLPQATTDRKEIRLCDCRLHEIRRHLPIWCSPSGNAMPLGKIEAEVKAHCT